MSERLVVIGGDAGGMTAASLAKKMRPDLDVIALEKGPWTSYSACGIPYVIGGDIKSVDELVVRTPEEHRANGIDARALHEATAIDLDKREVEVRDIEGARTYRVGFDQLIIATGSTPRRPPIPGFMDEKVHGVQTLDDGAHLLRHAEKIGADRVVVVGAGYIGLEIAEAFVKRGASVTVVEREPEVLAATMDPEMGARVRAAMERHGIDVRVGAAVEAFDGKALHTAGGDIPADLVVLGLGVVPNSALAKEAGIEQGAHDAIGVDVRQRTSAEGVWAAGDCCESFHLVSHRKVHIALGTVANKQGRVVGINVGGGYATFPGVVGTAVTKLCDTEIARTGLSEREATQVGFRFVVGHIESTTRAGYYPGAKPINVKILAQPGGGELLGAQIVGEEGAAKRIDVLATALTARFTVEDLLHLDLSYAPPFAPVWDPVLMAARKAWDAVQRERTDRG
ncbi:MAG: FAD-dependent oxidoreductase [Acidimicrobiia bacterium]|nr:FAD-dependent oxidoreductase [Acidimicrobiia bacterium]MBV8986306.1 FAD-dependent oxidoreductase [Acidimicrobiia bacterium]